MPSTNFTIGKNIGILLAETAQQKFFGDNNYDIEAAKNVFIESLGCDDNIADKLFKGEYVLVRHPDDKTLVNCIERKDLDEDQKNDYPVLDPSMFTLSFFNKIGQTNANYYIQDLRDVRDAIYNNIVFHIDVDLSDILLKNSNAIIDADIHLSAREIATMIIRDDELSDEFSSISKQVYLVRAKGMIHPNMFSKYIYDIVFIKKRKDVILNAIEYFKNSNISLTDKTGYDFFKIRSIVNFASELYDHIKSDFVNIADMYRNSTI